MVSRFHRKPNTASVHSNRLLFFTFEGEDFKYGLEVDDDPERVSFYPIAPDNTLLT
jgi:hypothetical protein